MSLHDQTDAETDDQTAVLERGAERDDWVGALCELALADDPEEEVQR
jgi:hypothetical protein